MIGILLAFFTGFTPPQPLVLRSVSGDIRVWMVAESLAAEVPPVTLHSPSEDVELKVAAGVPLKLQTVSGDIRVDFGGPLEPFPPFVWLETTSGDIVLEDLPPCTLFARTFSGDLSLRGRGVAGPGRYRLESYSGEVSGTLPLVPTVVRTFSGDISLRVPEGPALPVPDTVWTFSGEVTLRYGGRSETVERSTTLTLGNRTLVVEVGTPWRWKRKERRPKPPNLDILRPVALRRTWGEVGGTPLPLDFNRVDGVALTLAFRRMKESRELPLRVQADVGVRIAFSRRIPGEASSLQERLGVWGALTVGYGQDPRLSFYAEGWSNMTGTFDRWVLSPVENALAAVFFAKDFYDYFLTSGLGSGLEVRGPGFWVLRAGFLAQELSPLPLGVTTTPFAREQLFAENPDFEPLSLRGLEVIAALRHSPLDFSLRYYRNARQPRIEQLMALVRLKGELPLGRLLLRLAAGKGTADFPFNFRLGGIGTLPAYEPKSFVGDRFALLNADFELPADLGDLIFFADVGEVRGYPMAVDLGVGLHLEPFSIRVARSLETPARFRVFLRLGDRY